MFSAITGIDQSDQQTELDVSRMLKEIEEADLALDSMEEKVDSLLSNLDAMLEEAEKN